MLGTCGPALRSGISTCLDRCREPGSIAGGSGTDEDPLGLVHARTHSRVTVLLDASQVLRLLFGQDVPSCCSVVSLRPVRAVVAGGDSCHLAGSRLRERMTRHRPIPPGMRRMHTFDMHASRKPTQSNPGVHCALGVMSGHLSTLLVRRLLSRFRIGFRARRPRSGSHLAPALLSKSLDSEVI